MQHSTSWSIFWVELFKCYQCPSVNRDSKLDWKGTSSTIPWRVHVSSHGEFNSNLYVSKSMLFYNPRSVVPNFDDLCAACELYPLDLICLMETWLNDTISDCELTISSHHLICLNLNRLGGGILIYAKSCLNCQVLCITTWRQQQPS